MRKGISTLLLLISCQYQEEPEPLEVLEVLPNSQIAYLLNDNYATKCISLEKQNTRRFVYFSTEDDGYTQIDHYYSNENECVEGEETESVELSGIYRFERALEVGIELNIKFEAEDKFLYYLMNSYKDYSEISQEPSGDPNKRNADFDPEWRLYRIRD